ARPLPGPTLHFSYGHRPAGPSDPRSAAPATPTPTQAGVFGATPARPGRAASRPPARCHGTPPTPGADPASPPTAARTDNRYNSLCALILHDFIVSPALHRWTRAAGPGPATSCSPGGGYATIDESARFDHQRHGGGHRTRPRRGGVRADASGSDRHPARASGRGAHVGHPGRSERGRARDLDEQRRDPAGPGRPDAGNEPSGPRVRGAEPGRSPDGVPGDRPAPRRDGHHAEA